MSFVDFGQNKADRLLTLINETLNKKGNGIGCNATKAIVGESGYSFRLDRVPDRGNFEAAQAKVAWLFFGARIVEVTEFSPVQKSVAMLVVPEASVLGAPPVSIKEKMYLLFSFVSFAYYSWALYNHTILFH